MARAGGPAAGTVTGKLFWKFFLSILLAQVAAAAGIGGVFWLREQARLSSRTQAIETGPPAAFLIDSAAVALKYGDLPALRELIGHMHRHTVYVVDAGGRDLLGREVTPAMRAQARRELKAERHYHPVRILSARDGGQWLAFVPARRNHAGSGGKDMADALPPDARDAPGALAAAARAQPGAPGAPPPPGFGGPRGPRGPFGPGWGVGTPMFVLASLLVSLLFAFLLAWYFSRPIRALRTAFEAAAAGDLAPRFGSSAAGGDELNDLGRDFDRMSGRLRALMDGQRRLLHDVSHELRSPLARLQAAIGLAHQQPDKIATSLARIERESERMDKLVGELLTLSRLEADPDLPKDELVDMQELVDAIALDARFEAETQGAAIDVGVDIDLALPAQVRGAPDLLWRAIENVVRNAMKHGGAGGVVELKLRTVARAVCIDVVDRGPGILEADLPTIFQPFFRSNPATNNVDGHGLGLAIAERVIRAHGGSITVANRAGGGLQVTITLPLAR
ncbi:sensor histidine kinase [Massilia niabensis]|uniref:histidine kinase n=1 Tax=Massilia niabensis TaxID=544910 RepID=A0ABW0L4R5_9BURK